MHIQEIESGNYSYDIAKMSAGNWKKAICERIEELKSKRSFPDDRPIIIHWEGELRRLHDEDAYNIKEFEKASIQETVDALHNLLPEVDRYLAESRMKSFPEKYDKVMEVYYEKLDTLTDKILKGWEVGKPERS